MDLPAHYSNNTLLFFSAIKGITYCITLLNTHPNVQYDFIHTIAFENKNHFLDRYTIQNLQFLSLYHDNLIGPNGVSIFKNIFVISKDTRANLPSAEFHNLNIYRQYKFILVDQYLSNPIAFKNLEISYERTPKLTAYINKAHI